MGAGASMRVLAAKKTSEDILKLYNMGPQNQLFAGSPAQDRFFQPTTPLVRLRVPVLPHADLECVSMPA